MGVGTDSERVARSGGARRSRTLRVIEGDMKFFLLCFLCSFGLGFSMFFCAFTGFSFTAAYAFTTLKDRSIHACSRRCVMYL